MINKEDRIFSNMSNTEDLIFWADMLKRSIDRLIELFKKDDLSSDMFLSEISSLEDRYSTIIKQISFITMKEISLNARS